jgi:DNA-binding NarL/FixJ family response regulator
VLVHQRMAWMAAATEANIAGLELDFPVTLVIDYPIGFALEVSSLLEPPFVVITGADSEYYNEHLLEQNPSALLCEPVAPADLHHALRLAAAGESVPFALEATPSSLTPREHQALRLLVQGLSDKEIARSMKVEPKTVAHWMQSLREKMGADSRAQVILRYWGK